jgi:membrane protein YdbS with pleckstrin-like domain
MKNNKHIKTIKPSHFMNIAWYLSPALTFLFPPLVFPTLIMAWYKYFEIETWKYNFLERTIEERKGVFSVTQEEVQYYRIKSIMIEEPLWMRFFGLCIINIITSEQFKPRMTLYAVNDGEQLKDLISDMTYQWRLKMNIRDHDIYNI